MSRALVLALAMVILALLLVTPHVGTQAQDEVEVKIRWVRYINPTDGVDIASGTCVFGDYIAVVGEVNQTPPYVATGRPYVVLLRKSDGTVVREWIGSERGAFINCISIDGKLYAVGATKDGDEPYGVIYVFDVNLNILAKVKSESPSVYFSLVYDDEGVLYPGGVYGEGVLYLGGLTYEDSKLVGLVEKRVLDTNISLINSKKISEGNVWVGWWKEGWIHDIGVSTSTERKRIWAVGFFKEDLKSETRSFIVIFNKDLGELGRRIYTEGSKEYVGWLTGIVLDDGEYVYISGSEGVVKFRVDGELIATNRDGRVRTKIVYGYGYLYTFGEYRIGGYWRHMLYVHDTDLNLVKSYVLSEGVNAHSYFPVGRPVLEGNSIYVAGIDYALGSGNSRVVVYSLSIEGVTATATTTITTTPTAATTITTTVTVTVPTTTTVTTTTTSTTTTTTTTTVTTAVPTAATTITTTVTTTVPTTTTVTTAVPTTTTVTATIPVTRNVTVTTTATAYTTILATTTIPISIPVLSIVTETLERTATVERVVERSITVEKPITATQTLTKAETTVVDRMTTPAIIALIAAGTLLAITTLILRR